MSEVPAPQTIEAPLANSPEARTTDGTLRDVNAPTSTQESTTKTDPATTTSTQNPPPAKPDAPAGAPEKYEFKAPEGYTLSDAIVNEAAPIFKELNLTQEQAQKLVDFHSKQMLDAAKAPQTAYETTRQQWKDETKTMLGDKYDATHADFGRFLSTLDAKDKAAFSEAMDITGAGDHPAFIKVLHPLIQRAIEGKAVTPGGPSPHGQAAPGTPNKSLAQSMYPNLPSASAS